MNIDPALQAQVQSMINKALRSLKASRCHLADADFDFAASRAYYAVFYAMEAALLTKEIVCSTHGGTITAFSDHFVKTRILPPEYGAKAARLFRERQVGDYEFDVSVTKPNAEEDVQLAVEFLEAIVRLLRASSFLPAG